MLRRRCEDTFIDSWKGKKKDIGVEIRSEEHYAPDEFFFLFSYLLMESVSTAHMPRVHAQDDPQPLEILIL